MTFRTWVLIALAGFAASGCAREAQSPIRTSPPATQEAGVAEAQPVWEHTQTRVRNGQPLDLALRELELSQQERVATLRALSKRVDFRRIHPGEVITAGRDASGNVREVVLQRDPRREVRVTIAEDGTTEVTTHEREPEVFLRKLQGSVEGSLYEAILAAGGDPDLVVRFADLLAWQVDFFTEPRKGDTFRILVEEERLSGENPGFGKILAAEYSGARASARAVRYVDVQDVRDWFDDKGRSVRRAFLKSPLNFRRISSRFTARRRHPILKVVRPHWGVDYAAPRGTPVSALGGGVITKIGRHGGFGNYIEVRHNSTYTTCYGHLQGFARGLKRGGRVNQGQVIGYVGSTGLSTGPHLDFRVKKNGQFVDPLRIESPPGRNIDVAERTRFEDYRERVWQLVERLEPTEALAPVQAWGRLTQEPAKSQLLAFSP